MPTTHTTPSINLVPLNLRVQNPVKAPQGTPSTSSSPVKAPQSHAPLLPITCYLLPILALLLSSISAGAHTSHAAPSHAPALRWRADTPATKPYAATIYRGETITLTPTLHAYNEPLPLPAGTTATLYYQTNGMHNLWWAIPGSATTNGTLAATFTPAHDTGAPTYNFFLAAEQHGTTTTRLYRAHGTITMRPSPGAQPNHLPLPTPTIDFSTIEILNPPWSDPTTLAQDLQTATNHLATQLQGEYQPYGPRLDHLENQSATYLRNDTANDITDSFSLIYYFNFGMGDSTTFSFTPFNIYMGFSTYGAHNYIDIVQNGFKVSKKTIEGTSTTTYGPGRITNNDTTYTLPTGPGSTIATHHDLDTAISTITAPMLQINGTYYRQYWDTNLLTTAWEPVP